MDRFTIIPTASCVVRQDNRVLALRRQNSTYMNGYLCLPGGHVEAGESLHQSISRELAEETGLVVMPEAWELFCIVQTVINSCAYMRFIFRTSDWNGKLRIGEPHKATDLDFYNLADMNSLTPADALIIKFMDKPGLTYLSLLEQDGNLVKSTVS